MPDRLSTLVAQVRNVVRVFLSHGTRTFQRVFKSRCAFLFCGLRRNSTDSVEIATLPLEQGQNATDGMTNPTSDDIRIVRRDNEDGTYYVSYYVTVAGYYALRVLYQGESVALSPHTESPAPPYHELQPLNGNGE
eukprot:81794-Prorocentrum_minimum.AAC.1